ncbi:8523_t:CDS:2, partial [Racocetra persica]
MKISEFDNKNWELENVLDNSGIGATIAHIRGANAGGITGAVASFPNVPLGLTGAQIILAQNVAKDWTIARRCPTNTVLVAPNARGGVSIILAGIRSEQRLWWIKKHYPTANKYVKMLEIGALRQGVYESKYGDQLGYTPAQKKPISYLDLAELELRHGILQQAPSQSHHAPIDSAISDFYTIKSEKPRQAFYIVDQEGNNMDPLIQDPDYLKYLEQAKALYKKPQRSNQS